MRMLAATAAFMLCAMPAQAADEALQCGGYLNDSGRREVLRVSSASATCPWIFAVPSVVIRCRGRQQAGAVTVQTEDGTSYALNGMAQHWEKLPPFDPIWKDDPQIPGAKMNLGSWIDTGLALCR